MNCEVCQLKEPEVEHFEIREVSRCMLHSIMFHRALGLVRPKQQFVRFCIRDGHDQDDALDWVSSSAKLIVTEFTELFEANKDHYGLYVLFWNLELKKPAK